MFPYEDKGAFAYYVIMFLCDLYKDKGAFAYYVVMFLKAFGEFNSINKKPQGNELNLARTKKVIEQFMIQLQVMRLKLRDG